MQPPFGDGHHHFAAHHLAFEMRIGVVLAGVVVLLMLDGLMGRELLQPPLVIRVQPRLVVIDKNTCRNVHRVDEAKPLRNATPLHQLFHLRRDIYKRPPCGDIKPKFFGERFHLVVKILNLLAEMLEPFPVVDAFVQFEEFFQFTLNQFPI